MDPKNNPKEAPTKPETPAISDRQLLEHVARICATTAQNQLIFGQELGALKLAYEELKDRVDRQSDRARGPSEHDLAVAKQLADEIAARESLATRVAGIDEKADAIAEIKKVVTAWWATPIGKLTAQAINLVLLAAWAYATTHINGK